MLHQSMRHAACKLSAQLQTAAGVQRRQACSAVVMASLAYHAGLCPRVPGLFATGTPLQQREQRKISPRIASCGRLEGMLLLCWEAMALRPLSIQLAAAFEPPYYVLPMKMRCVAFAHSHAVHASVRRRRRQLRPLRRRHDGKQRQPTQLSTKQFSFVRHSRGIGVYMYTSR